MVPVSKPTPYSTSNKIIIIVQHDKNIILMCACAVALVGQSDRSDKMSGHRDRQHYHKAERCGLFWACVMYLCVHDLVLYWPVNQWSATDPAGRLSLYRLCESLWIISISGFSLFQAELQRSCSQHSINRGAEGCQLLCPCRTYPPVPPPPPPPPPPRGLTAAGKPSLHISLSRLFSKRQMEIRAMRYLYYITFVRLGSVMQISPHRDVDM